MLVFSPWMIAKTLPGPERGSRMSSAEQALRCNGQTEGHAATPPLFLHVLRHVNAASRADDAKV